MSEVVENRLKLPFDKDTKYIQFDYDYLITMTTLRVPHKEDTYLLVLYNAQGSKLFHLTNDDRLKLISFLGEA